MYVNINPELLPPGIKDEYGQGEIMEALKNLRTNSYRVVCANGDNVTWGLLPNYDQPLGSNKWTRLGTLPFARLQAATDVPLPSLEIVS